MALSFGFGSGAKALPLSFTWNPSATPDSTIGPFTADTFEVGDFATIHVPANPTVTGSVTETGYLLPDDFFDAAGNEVASANVRGTFGMYESFTATSHLAPCSSGECGSFDTVTATLYIYSTALGTARLSFASPTAAPTITLPLLANPIQLATISGPIGGSPNNADITNGVPNAAVDASFTASTTYPAFFVSPPSSIILDLEQAFTNTTGVITTYDPLTGKVGPCSTTECVYQIHNGGGNANFISSVPEPGTLAVLGFGLASLGFVRRRKTA